MKRRIVEYVGQILPQWVEDRHENISGSSPYEENTAIANDLLLSGGEPMQSSSTPAIRRVNLKDIHDKGEPRQLVEGLRATEADVPRDGVLPSHGAHGMYGPLERKV